MSAAGTSSPQSSIAPTPVVGSAIALDPDEILALFGTVPTVAPIALKVIRMVDDEAVTVNELAAVISTDPGLATRLLRLANSAAYSRGRPVTDLGRAAMLLGLRTLKLVTLGFSLNESSPDGGSGAPPLIWRRSLATAALARRFAAAIGADLAEDAFTAGLLSNVGKTALLDVPEFATWFESYEPWPTPAEERANLGFTTDELTARLLDGWNIPAALCEAIGSRHPELSSEPQQLLSGVLRLADWAAALLLTDDQDAAALALDEATLAAAYLGTTIDGIETAVAAAMPELDELTDAFDVDGIGSVPIDEIVRSAQVRMAQLSLDIASQIGEEQQRNDELEVTNRRLAAAASTDGLTGLANRRTFDAFVGNQVASRQRRERRTALGLALMDLDEFKSVNDTHGHSVGDEVLVELGRRFAAGCRAGELAARVGGEEFALVMPDVDVHELAGAGERLRRMMADEPVHTAVGPLLVTVSVGISHCFEVDSSTEQRLYATADAALYTSKSNGRNQVTIVALED